MGRYMKVKKQKFGTLSNGEKVSLYTISNGQMSFSVTNFGCCITAINVPSKTGKVDNVTLGFSDLAGYIRNIPHFGAIIGRYANRIAKASFTLNGKKCSLDKNNGKNCLHSGFIGYDKVLWEASTIKVKKGRGVRFTRTSPNGEQGFPGNLELEVTYILTDNNEILLRYRGVCDKDTPINMTNHAYFNLKGTGDILDHQLTINADAITEINDELVPTGKIMPVKGTAFDFTQPHTIGERIKESGGYDHNYCINKAKGKLKVCATVFEPTSGRTMVVATNQPGVQFYSGNFLEGREGRLGLTHKVHEGFCLETQAYPNALNIDSFPNSILKVGETYDAVTMYGFMW